MHKHTRKYRRNEIASTRTRPRPRLSFSLSLHKKNVSHNFSHIRSKHLQLQLFSVFFSLSLLSFKWIIWFIPSNKIIHCFFKFKQKHTVSWENVCTFLSAAFGKFITFDVVNSNDIKGMNVKPKAFASRGNPWNQMIYQRKEKKFFFLSLICRTILLKNKQTNK